VMASDDPVTVLGRPRGEVVVAPEVVARIVAFRAAGAPLSETPVPMVRGPSACRRLGFGPEGWQVSVRNGTDHGLERTG